MEETRAVFDSPHFRIIQGIDHAFQPREGNGGGTHGTGFEGYIDDAAVEPFGLHVRAGAADGQNFGVRRWVMVFNCAVACCSNNGSGGIRYHSAHGYFGAGCCLPGLGKSALHGGGKDCFHRLSMGHPTM